MQNIATGFLVGTGAAQNVSCGFIPNFVMLVNLTDGDKVWMGALRQVVPFSSGGTNEIVANDKLKGATSSATFRVKQVLLMSGSWAAGDAAGFFIVEDIVGTIGSENVYVIADGGSNDATVTVNVSMGIDVDTEVAGVASGSGVTPLYGGAQTTPVPDGFTIATGVSEDNKLLFYVAMRDGPGQVA